MRLALGLIETNGLVAAIEAADAMVKAANVTLIGKEKTNPALITIKIIGEVAAVKSAVDAGAAAAARVGKVVSTHVIPRPDSELSNLIPEIKSADADAPTAKIRRAPRGNTKEALDAEQAQTSPTQDIIPPQEAASLIAEEIAAEVVEDRIEPAVETKSEVEIYDDLFSQASADNKTEKISRQKTEKKAGAGAKTEKEKSIIPEEPADLSTNDEPLTNLSAEDLETLNVHQLRRLARNTPRFPIQGREISKANRQELLYYFRQAP